MRHKKPDEVNNRHRRSGGDFGEEYVSSEIFSFARLVPSLTFCARLLEQAFAGDLFLRLEARVKLMFVLVAGAGEPPPIPNLLVAALERQDLLDALRVVVQRQRWVHAAEHERG